MGFVNGKVGWVREQQSKKKADADTFGSLVRALTFASESAMHARREPITGKRPPG